MRKMYIIFLIPPASCYPAHIVHAPLPRSERSWSATACGLLVYVRHNMLYAGASDRRRIDMVEIVTALDAYRDGKLLLPPGYTIEHGADVLLLRREGGSVVAAFSDRGATAKEVKRTAWDDHRQSSNTA